MVTIPFDTEIGYFYSKINMSYCYQIDENIKQLKLFFLGTHRELTFPR